MGSVGGESHGAVVVETGAQEELSQAGKKESSEEQPRVPEAEINREHPSVKMPEDPHEDASMDVIEEPHEGASVEVIEEPPLPESDIREVTEEPHLSEVETGDVAEEPDLPEGETREVTEEPSLPEAEINREDTLMDVNEEPHILEKCEDFSVDVIQELHLKKGEDAVVDVIEEPHLPEAESREDGSVNVIEKPDLPEAETGDVAEEPDLPEGETREVTEEPSLPEAKIKREDTSAESLEQKLSEVMGAGMGDKVDNGAMMMSGGAGAMMGNADAVVPAPKRKLPSVQRFSARRSAGVDGKSKMDDGTARNGDASGSDPPSAIRKQRGAHRVSSRVGMGVDDRDTVDYGTVDDPPLTKPAKLLPKPVATASAGLGSGGSFPPVAAAAAAGAEGTVLTTPRKAVLSVAEREQLRLQNVKRNKEIVCLERVRGRLVNITAGLELHTGVFSRVEQQRLVELVRELQAKGRRNELEDRTYSEPKKWMRGKGRVTLQFGCCYNYAIDKSGNLPGILREEVVDPIPPLLRSTIKRLVRWHVLPPTCVPDSCIINMYEEGDCIPPHIDHHDFLRPFCTLSLLSECIIVFGANLEVLGPGDFGGSMSLPLPMGSVLVLAGNGADVAKHAIPAVPSERISITFRKMDPAKVPRGFTIDKELQNLRPAALPAHAG